LYYPLGYKPALDGSRAVAILAVLLFHGGAPGFGWGYIGVDLFFVLSGYLITSILLVEHAKVGRISLLDFYRRRALRLFPALAALCLTFLVYAAVALDDPTQGIREVLIVALYAGNWIRAFSLGQPQYLGHTWSLAIEEQLYLVWPLLIWGVLFLSKGSAAKALRLVVALAIASIGWRAILALQGATADRLYNGSDTRADALLIGAALALALATPAVATPVASVARYLWLPAAVTIVVVPAFLPWHDTRMLLGGFSLIALAGRRF
jgi:peptidoglycan/LPS O-acetylase OafA/YrhL